MTRSAQQLDREIAHVLVPGIVKWHMHAGGTGSDKHGYVYPVPQGTYRIDPVSTKYGRHAYYQLYFTAEKRIQPKGSHGGLWHDLGKHRSPAAAAKAAREHYARSF